MVIVSRIPILILHSLLLEVHWLVGLPVLSGDNLKTKSANLANSVDDVLLTLDSHPLISWVVFESEMWTNDTRTNEWFLCFQFVDRQFSLTFLSP